MEPSKSTIRRICLGLIILLSVAGIVFVFYLSWLPEPTLSTYNLLPNWLTRWTDAQQNDTMRTAVPFIGLGFVIGGYLSATGRKWRWWLSSWIGLTLIVLVAEVGQLTIPHRSFDWDDIAWGCLGSLVGLLLTSSTITSIRFVARKLYQNNHTFPEKR